MATELRSVRQLHTPGKAEIQARPFCAHENLRTAAISRSSIDITYVWILPGGTGSARAAAIFYAGRHRVSIDDWAQLL